MTVAGCRGLVVVPRRSHLLRRLYVDPGRKHHAGIQRLGSDPEINQPPAVHGPDVLTAAAHADQADVSWDAEKQRT